MKRFFFLILAVCGGSQATPLPPSEASALLERFEASRRDHVIEVRFTERRTLPLLADPVKESGTLQFEAPDKFRRRTDTGNEIVSDGKSLWLSYPEFAQVERYPLDHSAGPGPAIRTFTRALQGRGLADAFRTSVASVGGVFHVTLEPRAAGLRRFVSRILLVMDPSLRLLSSTLEGRDGERIETVFETETLHPPGSVDFAFHPPAGSTLVDPFARSR